MKQTPRPPRSRPPQRTRRKPAPPPAEPRLIALNKPFDVLTQFTDGDGRATLRDFVSVPGVYPAGRLDYDSEGLLLLTNHGALQHRIASPTNKMPKTYWVQVEGEISDDAIGQLCSGVELKDGLSVLEGDPADRQRQADGRTGCLGPGTSGALP